jgi:hypothetical protein
MVWVFEVFMLHSPFCPPLNAAERSQKNSESEDEQLIN